MNLSHLPEGAKIVSHAPDLSEILCLSPLASYRILLQGAQLLEWAPLNQAPVIWLSPHAQFIAGKSPRGGTPICWPWFGPAKDPKLPAHGLVRNKAWTLNSFIRHPDGSDEIQFSIATSPDITPEWPHKASLTLTYRIGDTLSITLETLNTDTASFPITEAIHTYFGVSDVRNIEILGLDATTYLDRLHADQRFIQKGPIRINAETDRVYISNATNCSIIDPDNHRQILIKTEGSHSRVVWNPWSDKASKLGDLGTDDYLRMVCVECGNIEDNAVQIDPGQAHRMHIEYSTDAIR